MPPFPPIPSTHVQVLLLFLVARQMTSSISFSRIVEPTKSPSVVVGNISRVEDALYFRIYYGRSFKVIKNDIDGQTYLLMQNNSRMAMKPKYCTGRIKSFVVPLSNYSVDATNFPVSFFEVSTAAESWKNSIINFIRFASIIRLGPARPGPATQTAFLVLLGMLDGLKGITSDASTSQCILKSLSSGNITLVNSTDIKELQQFAAHFLSFKQEIHTCNSVTFAPLAELTPLKRAEWIKYLGTFANAEVRANAVYDAVKSNYDCIRRKVAAAQASRFKPVVGWIKYSQGIWSFAKEQYKKQYVMDAGGENVDDTITRSSYNISSPADMEEFHAILCTVDVVMDETHAEEPKEYTLSTFLGNINIANFENSCFEFLANKSIWRYDKRARDSKAIDWFDGGISQPQLVLADLVEALFPTGNYTTTFFRNMAKGESVVNIDEDMCDRSDSTALEPTIVPCQY